MNCKGCIFTDDCESNECILEQINYRKLNNKEKGRKNKKSIKKTRRIHEETEFHN